MTPELAAQVLKRLNDLEQLVYKHNLADRYRFALPLDIMDGRNIALGSSTGTKIGTAASQKIGLYGVTPVIQATAISAPISPGASYNQGDAATAVTAINAIRNAIKNIGVTA